MIKQIFKHLKLLFTLLRNSVIQTPGRAAVHHTPGSTPRQGLVRRTPAPPISRRPSSAWTPENLSMCRDGGNSARQGGDSGRKGGDSGRKDGDSGRKGGDKSRQVSDRLASLDAYTNRLAQQGCTYSPVQPTVKAFNETPYRPPRGHSPKRGVPKVGLSSKVNPQRLAARLEPPQTLAPPKSSEESQELEGLFMSVMEDLNV